MTRSRRIGFAFRSTLFSQAAVGFLVSVLCCAVFVWVLQYKLSLYQSVSGNAAPTVPVAKGIEERVASAISDGISAPKPYLPVPLSFTLLAGFAAAVLLRTRWIALRRVPARIEMPPRLAASPALRFRPPPFSR